MAHQEPHSPRVATMTSPGPTPPLLPIRSPLRPRPPARSISSQSDITNLDFAAIAEAAIPPEYLSLSRHKSADMTDGLRDSSLSGIDPHFILLTDKRPDSLLSLDLEEAEGEANSDEGRPTSTSTGTSGRTTTTTDSSNSTAPSSTLASHTSTTTGMTKRHHALHELLSSERAYASDLALIREVHIPLALGEGFAFYVSLLFLCYFCFIFVILTIGPHGNHTFTAVKERLPTSCAAWTNHPRTHTHTWFR